MPNARLARSVVAAELLIVLAMSPALLFPTPGRAAVLLVVPVIWLCARIAGDPVVPRTPLNAAIWLMLAMVGVSLHATFDIQFSLGKVCGVLLGVLLFWAIARWLTTMERLQAVTAVFVLAGACLAVAGLLGTNGAWFDKFPTLGAISARLPRVIRGVPGAENGFNPNAVAGPLVLFIPVQLALLGTGAHRWWVSTGRTAVWLAGLQVLLLLLTAGTVVLMQSRSAWAGLAVATVAFLYWYGWPTRVLAMVVTITGLVMATTLGPASLFTLDIGRPGPGGPQGNMLGRIEIWSRALDAIRHHPFTGVGMGAFRKVMPVLPGSPTSDMAHAHNNLLQAAVDLGLPGLIAYLSIWIVASTLLVRTYLHARTRPLRALAGGLGAGLIAHFMFGVVDAIPLGTKVGVLFWLTLALTAGLHSVAMAPQPATGTSAAQ